MARRKRTSRRRRRRSRKLALWGWVVAAAAALAAVGVSRWLQAPPSSPEDACAVFRDKPAWYRSLRSSEQAWKVPKAVQLAILYQESGLRARIRPARRKILWILPWRRPSSAYGYGQVLDGTWRDYQRRAGRPRARRSSFRDVADFVGWYADQIHRVTGVRKTDAYNLYLAYHEGPAGYSRGSHRDKEWLLKTARQVAARTERYQRQLSRCEDSLRWLGLRQRALQVGGLLTVAIAALLILRRRRRSSRRTRARSRGR